jgi:hypothetical protein
MTADGKAIAAAYTAMEKLAVSYVDTPTANNVIHQISNPFNWRQDIARVDFRINDKHSIYYRYLHDMYDLIEPYGTFSSSNLPMTPTNRLRPGYSNQLAHTWLISPMMTNEAKVNVSWNGQRIPMVGDYWKRSTYGFTSPTIFNATSWNGNGGIPNIAISNFANLRGSNFVLISPTTDIQMIDNFTIIKHSHIIKAGVTVIRNRKDQNGRSDWLGSASFSTGGNTKTTGMAMADAFLGNFRSYTETSADPIGHFRFTSFEGYVSDSWKISRKLSLEYGVRWQRNLPTYVSGNNITNFNPSLYDPTKAVTVLPNGTIVPGSGNRFNGLITAGDGIPSDEAGRISGIDQVAFAVIPKGAPRGMYDARFQRVFDHHPAHVRLQFELPFDAGLRQQAQGSLHVHDQLHSGQGSHGFERQRRQSGRLPGPTLQLRSCIVRPSSRFCDHLLLPGALLQGIERVYFEPCGEWRLWRVAAQRHHPVPDGRASYRYSEHIHRKPKGGLPRRTGSARQPGTERLAQPSGVRVRTRHPPWEFKCRHCPRTGTLPLGFLHPEEFQFGEGSRRHAAAVPGRYVQRMELGELQKSANQYGECVMEHGLDRGSAAQYSACA